MPRKVEKRKKLTKSNKPISSPYKRRSGQLRKKMTKKTKRTSLFIKRSPDKYQKYSLRDWNSKSHHRKRWMTNFWKKFKLPKKVLTRKNVNKTNFRKNTRKRMFSLSNWTSKFKLSIDSSGKRKGDPRLPPWTNLSQRWKKYR